MKRNRHERGNYRAILVVLLDGKDFRKLTAAERWTFVCLKMVLGPCQIGVVDAIEHVLAEKTGHPTAVVRKALATLERDGWIRRGNNITWVVEGLRYEPSYSHNDDKHRKAVQAFVGALPRNELVDEFIDHYGPFFGRPIEGPAKGLGRPIEAGIPITDNERLKTEDGKGKRETEDRQGKTETDKEQVGESAPRAEVLTRIARAVNAAMTERFGEDLQPYLPTSGGAAAIYAAVESHAIPVDFAESTLYEHAMKCREKPNTLSYFAKGLIRAWQESQARADAKGVAYQPMQTAGERFLAKHGVAT